MDVRIVGLEHVRTLRREPAGIYRIGSYGILTVDVEGNVRVMAFGSIVEAD